MTTDSDLRKKLYDIVFGYDTPAGRAFDIVLIVSILLSVFAVMLDSVQGIQARYGELLYATEWFFTLLFTAEYLLRLYITDSRRKYATSFFGIVDLLSILPTYLAFFYPHAAYLIVIRVLRVLRIFRVLKLIRYMGEANIMLRALKHSKHKVVVFIYAVLALNVLFGSVMYLVEGPENGYTSIPVSIYWSIVTMTTVGYGDIAPLTDFGRVIAALAMLTGYAIIAVPTGIVSSELMQEFYNQRKQDINDYTIVCPHCNRQGHDRDAIYCKQCGGALSSPPP